MNDINELRLLADDLHSLSGPNKYATAMSRAADELERLRTIEAAAKNLAAVKGRHHTEIAYKRLEATLKPESLK